MGSRPDFGVCASPVAHPQRLDFGDEDALRGKVILVTGGCQGLGTAVAQTLGEAGARLVVTDASFQQASECAARLCGQGVEALGLQLDLADPADCAQAVATVHARFGRLDALINNAVIDVSAARQAAALMAGQVDGGHIVNVAPAGIRVFAVAAGGLQTRILFDPFPDLDALRLQDPQQVARAVRLLLQQAPSTCIDAPGFDAGLVREFPSH